MVNAKVTSETSPEKIASWQRVGGADIWHPGARRSVSPRLALLVGDHHIPVTRRAGRTTQLSAPHPDWPLPHGQTGHTDRLAQLALIGTRPEHTQGRDDFQHEGGTLGPCRRRNCETSRNIRTIRKWGAFTLRSKFICTTKVCVRVGEKRFAVSTVYRHHDLCMLVKISASIGIISLLESVDDSQRISTNFQSKPNH